MPWWLVAMVACSTPSDGPFRRDAAYVVAANADGWTLVSVAGDGQVTHRFAIEGYDRTSGHPVLVVLDSRRTAWIRPAGAGAEAVARDPDGTVRVLGPAWPDRRAAVGWIGGRWAWSSDEHGVAGEPGGALPDLPEAARFAGGDALGRPCAVAQGSEYSHLGSIEHLWCHRDGGWVEQPRDLEGGFGRLVDGGTAADWRGETYEDCGMPNVCGVVLPLEGVGSVWPVEGRARAVNAVVAAGRVAHTPNPETGGRYRVFDPEVVGVGPVPGVPVAWAVDGSFLLLEGRDGLVVYSIAGGTTAPLSEPLSASGPTPVEWR